MKTVTIRISDDTMRHIESLIEAGEYLNVEEYFLMLVERERHSGELPLWMVEELSKRIERIDRGEGGEPVEWTPETAKKMKEDFLRRLQQRRGEVA